MALPAVMDYRSVRGLSVEVQQKLNQHMPETVGQATRISGMTPAAISLLLVHLKRGFMMAAANRLPESIDTANSPATEKAQRNA